MAVVVPVVRSPPDRPLLRSSTSQKRQTELKEATRVVRAVRKVAVVCACYGEHTYYVEGKAHHNRNPTHTDPQRRKACNVNSPEHTLLKDVHE
jgi:hypothetical protein